MSETREQELACDKRWTHRGYYRSCRLALGHSGPCSVESSPSGGIAPARPDQADSLCQWCGGPHGYDTSVPSVMWNQNIRAAGLPDYLCLSCIVRAFARHGQSFTATLWGQEFNGTALEVRVDEAEALDARAVSDENTNLRAQLQAAEAACAQLQQEKDCLEAELEDWRSWAQFVYLGGGRFVEPDDTMRRRVCETHDAQVNELQARLTALQQERDMLRADATATLKYWKQAEQDRDRLQGQVRKWRTRARRRPG